jgi:hypothetical protein
MEVLHWQARKAKDFQKRLQHLQEEAWKDSSLHISEGQRYCLHHDLGLAVFSMSRETHHRQNSTY